MKKSIILMLVLTMVVSLTACGKKSNDSSVKEVPLTDIQKAVQDAYGEDYIASMPYDKAYLKDVLGVSEDLYDDFIAEGPTISVNVDTFVVIKAKDGQVAKVEEALNAYRDRLISDTMQYPMNLPKINASKVITKGNYAFFIQLGIIPMEVEETGDEDAIAKAFEEENQKAVDAINKVFE